MGGPGSGRRPGSGIHTKTKSGKRWKSLITKGVKKKQTSGIPKNNVNKFGGS